MKAFHLELIAWLCHFYLNVCIFENYSTSAISFLRIIAQVLFHLYLRILAHVLFQLHPKNFFQFSTTGFTPAMDGLAFGTGSMAPTTNLTNPPCTGDNFHGSFGLRNILRLYLVEEGHITSYNCHHEILTSFLVQFSLITSILFQTEAFPVDVGQGSP